MGIKIASFVAPFALMMAVAAPAAPATPMAPAAPAAPADAQENDSDSDLVIDLQTVTCKQFFKAQTYAIPGDNPTAEREELAEIAQDELVLAMMWVNGYLTGRDGAKIDHTFNDDWIIQHMRKLTQICKANSEEMLLSAAAAQL